LIAGALASGGPVQATLFDRGNGLIYDDVLNSTWLQDVMHARTPGGAGVFTWADAKSWVDQLSYGGFDDWRLPTLTPVGGPTFNFSNSKDGSTDYGYNIAYPGRTNPFDPPSKSPGFTGNEMAHMFFVNLGNLARFTVNDVHRTGEAFVDWGLVNASFVDGATGETVAFINLPRTVGFWLDYPETNNPRAVTNTFAFLTLGGFNDVSATFQRFNAWAVRDGDVAPAVDPPNSVPEPGTLLILLVGLLLSLALRRRI
jgi:PEP-CTERM motif